jgi:hypothetical protein
MNLPECQIRELKVQLLGTPPVSPLGHNQLDHLHRGAGNVRYLIFIQ